jgi:hypothetical protein
MYKSLSRFMQRHGIKSSTTYRKPKRRKAVQIVKQYSSSQGGKNHRQPGRLEIQGQVRVICPFGCGYSAPKLEVTSHIKVVHECFPFPEQSPSGVPVNIFYTRLRYSHAFTIRNRIRAVGGVAYAIQVEDDAVSRRNFGRIYCFEQSPESRRGAANIVHLIKDVASLEIFDSITTSPSDVHYAIWLGADAKVSRSHELMRHADKAKTMLSCPRCPAKVREDRLARHVRRAHPTDR